MPRPAAHDHGHHHRAAHGHAAHVPAPAGAALGPAWAAPRFQALASTAGARLMRVTAALAVLWAAVAWALWSS